MYDVPVLDLVPRYYIVLVGSRSLGIATHGYGRKLGSSYSDSMQAETPRGCVSSQQTTNGCTGIGILYSVKSCRIG